MRDKRCEPVRRELEELMLGDDYSVATNGHLQTCPDCRDFQRQQTKLRQIVGSLGTVNAPADFDFRLRARLAADSETPSFRFWTFTVKGLATAAVLVVFGVGAVVVWQRSHGPQPATVAVTTPPVEEPIRREEPNPTVHYSIQNHDTIPAVADNQTPPRRRSDRPRLASTPKRTVSSIDFSSERANVVSNTRPAINNAPVFPIEASVQSFRISLDDGRGNERTISLPTVSFGSQRMLPTANQSSLTGAW
ncbi:MAG TPA: hypothetical protein VJS13_00475 [Pyrinomonadaceae bacterium]|nr:hypothetical protein [Pyrinomonadaceae bacterium]